MRDLGTSYMEFMAHPDEPDYTGAGHRALSSEIDMADKDQLKSGLFGRIF